jgi:hypothetical protein
MSATAWVLAILAPPGKGLALSIASVDVSFRPSVNLKYLADILLW